MISIKFKQFQITCEPFQSWWINLLQQFPVKNIIQQTISDCAPTRIMHWSQWIKPEFKESCEKVTYLKIVDENQMQLIYHAIDVLPAPYLFNHKTISPAFARNFLHLQFDNEQTRFRQKCSRSDSFLSFIWLLLAYMLKMTN